MAAATALLRASGFLEKSTATEHATSSSSTATEHATTSSSTATEHATSYAFASASTDGLHLAENFAQWQPPAQLHTFHHDREAIGRRLARGKFMRDIWQAVVANIPRQRFRTNNRKSETLDLILVHNAKIDSKVTYLCKLFSSSQQVEEPIAADLAILEIYIDEISHAYDRLMEDDDDEDDDEDEAEPHMANAMHE